MFLQRLAATLKTTLEAVHIEWDARAKELGGNSYSLVAGFAARISDHIGRRRADGAVSLLIAINLRDVRGKETRRLASLPAPGIPGTAGLGWRFEAETLSWGNQVIDRAMQCDLLVIDELGPLELRDNAGLYGAFAAIDARDYTLAVVVVRPELIPEALHRWPEAQVVLPLGLRSFDTFTEMTS